MDRLGSASLIQALAGMEAFRRLIRALDTFLTVLLLCVLLLELPHLWSIARGGPVADEAYMFVGLASYHAMVLWVPGYVVGLYMAVSARGWRRCSTLLLSVLQSMLLVWTFYFQ